MQDAGNKRHEAARFHAYFGYSPEFAVVSATRRAFSKARVQTRASRRLAARTAYVVNWWASLPEPWPEFMTPLSLQRALDQPMRRMAAALRWLGWRKIVRRVHGKQTPLWLPPASTITPRARGRPRIYERL